MQGPVLRINKKKHLEHLLFLRKWNVLPQELNLFNLQEICSISESLIPARLVRLWQIEHRVVGIADSPWIPELGLYGCQSAAAQMAASMDGSYLFNGTMIECRVTPDLHLWQVDFRVVGDPVFPWISLDGVYDDQSCAVADASWLSSQDFADGAVNEYRVSRYQ